MILSSLCEYYGYLSRGGKTIPDGYSDILVTHTVSLSPEGKVVGVISKLTVEDKKKIYPIGRFPKRTEKTAIDANIVEHRPLYLFGLEANKEAYFESEKAKRSHAAFVQKNEKFFEGSSHPLSKAFLNFIKNWQPSEEINNEYLADIIKEYPQSRFAFTLQGRPDLMLQDIDEVKDKWQQLFAAESDEESILAQCPILGEVLPVARLHNKIKGVRDGQSSGCSLVCFNNESENSYGKEQSYNSAVSEKAMRQYTEALNYLMKEAAHNTYVSGSGMTIVHFAMTTDEEPYLNSFNQCVLMALPEELESAEASTDREVGAVIKKTVYGTIPTFDVTCNDNVMYCIFGLVPNASRLSVRFFYRNTFGVLRKNVERYHSDFAIADTGGAPPIWRACRSLLRKGSTEDIPAGYVECFLEAILNGARFPVKILSAVVRRTRTDNYVSDERAGLIKACLIRRNNKFKEVIKMGLNKDNHDAAYLCGRLFAVLEKIQKDSVPGVKLNRTVKDTYFTAASATPAAIFARMVPLAQKHLAKIENEGAVRYLDNLVTDIINDIAAFPKTLSLEEQAEFILGYYQQNKELYTKKTEKQEEN